MKEKTRKRMHLAVIWILVLIFAASGVLLYLPSLNGTGDASATPAPAQQAPFGY